MHASLLVLKFSSTASRVSTASPEPFRVCTGSGLRPADASARLHPPRRSPKLLHEICGNDPGPAARPDIVSSVSGVAQVTGAQRHRAIGESEPLQYRFGMCSELFQRLSERSGDTICAVPPFRTDAGGSCRGILIEPASLRKHGVCATSFSGNSSASRIRSHQIGERYLGGRNQINGDSVPSANRSSSNFGNWPVPVSASALAM